MKALTFLLIIFFSLPSWAKEIPRFKKGDCITDHPEAKYIVSRVENIDQKYQLYEISLFTKENIKEKNSKYVRFDINLTFASQKDFVKVKCFSNLPK